MYLDKDGKRLTPVYNYMKPMPEGSLNHCMKGMEVWLNSAVKQLPLRSEC